MGNELTTIEEQMRSEAEQYASMTRTDSSFISFKGGVFRVDDEPVPGNELVAVVLDVVFENTFYTTEWDPEKNTPPTCFAMARSQDELAPHPDMQADLNFFEPQNDECKGCQWNDWGSAEILKSEYGLGKGGRGKACGNRFRIAMIPAGMYVPRKGSRDLDLEIYEDEENYKTAPVVILKTPPTSLKNVGNYLKGCGRDYGRPPYGLVTRVYSRPVKTYHEICFEVLDEMPVEYLPTVQARHEEAKDIIISPYAPPDEEQDAPARSRGRLAGLPKG